MCGEPEGRRVRLLLLAGSKVKGSRRNRNEFSASRKLSFDLFGHLEPVGDAALLEGVPGGALRPSVGLADSPALINPLV